MEFNPKVNVIPTFKNSPGVKKVGIYARVSTARVEQLRSLAAQISALSQYVYQRNDMIIRDSVTEIEGNPFVNCGKLVNVSVSQEHPYLSMIDGVLFSKPDQCLIWCPMDLEGTYELPEGTEMIGSDAFCLCNNLQKIVIPDKCV